MTLCDDGTSHLEVHEEDKRLTAETRKLVVRYVFPGTLIKIFP